MTQDPRPDKNCDCGEISGNLLCHPHKKQITKSQGKIERANSLIKTVRKLHQNIRMSENISPDSSKSKVERVKSMKKYQNRAELLRGNFQNLGRVNWIDSTEVDASGDSYNIIDLFSGAGGLTLGFEEANYNSILGIEHDEDAAATYDHNFENTTQINKDIREVSSEEVREAIDDREIHVLLAGFPCPGFSIAGERNPEDERNFLYQEIIRILDAIDPWFIVMENVPGITTIEDGEAYDMILDDFEDAGYPLATQILEAADYEVPQIRSRSVFIGNKFNLENPYPKKVLSEGEYLSCDKYISDLKSKERDPSINHEWTDHREDTIERISEVGPGESLYDSYKDAWKRQYPGVPSMAIKENHGGVHIHPELNRCISAREMARLQTFPDDFYFEGRMKRTFVQIGNAVPVNLAKHVALGLRPTLDEV
jgi:DNA (cytosine-5)-methyltransferase 1